MIRGEIMSHWAVNKRRQTRLKNKRGEIKKKLKKLKCVNYTMTFWSEWHAEAVTIKDIVILTNGNQTP